MVIYGKVAAARAGALAFVTVPAFYAAVAFAGGIAAAQIFFRPASWLLLASALGFGAALACPQARPRLRLTALLAAWLCAGMFCAEAEARPLPAPALRAALLQADDGHALTGVVAPAPRHTAPTQDQPMIEEQPAQSLDIALTSIDGVPVRDGQGRQIARLRVTHAAGQPLPRCGDAVAVVAKLHAPPRYYTPGAWNSAAWLAQEGILAEGSVHADALSILPQRHRRFAACALATARERALELMDMVAARSARWPQSRQFAALSSQDVGLLAAALLGDRSQLDPAERTDFQRVGAFHLLVVSGLGIAILGGYLWWLLRRLRCSRTVATLLTLGLLALYAQFTGMGAPVERALLMLAVYMAGRLFYRRVRPLNTLSVAALALLAVSPAALLTASLQMTLLAVVAIAGVAAPLLERSISPWIRATRQLYVLLDAALPPQLAQFRVMLRLWAEALRPALGPRLAAWLPAALARGVLRLGELAFVSCVLQFAMALPMAVYFHRVVALGLGANVLTVPLLALVLPLGFLTAALACFSVGAALAPASATAVVLHLAQRCVHLLAVRPAAEWRTPPTCAPGIALALACVALAVVFACRRGKVSAAAAVCFLVAAGAFALAPVPRRVHRNVLEVTALDVGQGDSIFVATPAGQTLLVDAGGPSGPFGSAGAGDFFGEDIVAPYLWSRGLRRLDAVALTHAHSDHMGGMPAVLRDFRPRELWIGANPPVPAYAALLQLAASLGVRVRALRAGDAFDFGGATVRVLAPPAGYQPGEIASNDDSLVLRLDYLHTAALLEGDAQHASEEAMLASPQDAPWLRADLLKVGHHGSMSSSTAPFLDAVRPEWAVISAGRHNLYGHPRYPILVRLNQRGARVARTDLDGAESFLLNGQTVVMAAP